MSDKRKQFETIFKKFKALFPHLGNENDGEALNALRAINKLLKKAKLDWHDVLTLMAPQEDSFFDLLMRLVEKEPDILVRLARAGATFFCSNKKIAFADVRIGEHCLTLPLTSRDFSEWLLHQYFKERKKAPKLTSERDAIRTLSAFARYEGGPRCDVYLRSALVGQTLYLDIGDETGRVIEISTRGWQVLPASPVKFQRMPGMAALPIPERGGNIRQLRRFVNLSDSDFTLFVGVLTDALFPGRTHVVLNLNGESGSGKTTAEKIARSVTDPSDVPAGTLPREVRDLFADVNACCVLSYDNTSSIPKPISDALCQVTSGTGFRKRKLYTDLEQVLIGGYRTVIVTSVHNAVTEPDLAERCVTMNLPHIASKQRHSETQLWKNFERERAAILGAVLDIVAHGLKHLPHAHVPDLPRLADFALWGVAIEGAFAPAGSFLAAFTASQAVATDATVEVSAVATAIAAFMEAQAAPSWDGTTTELWRLLLTRDQAESRPTETKGWPHDPISFGIALTKITATLRKIGIEVTRDRATSRRRTPVLHLRRVEQEERPQQRQQATSAAEGSEGSEGSEPSRKIVPFRGN